MLRKITALYLQRSIRELGNEDRKNVLNRIRATATGFKVMVTKDRKEVEGPVELSVEVTPVFRKPKREVSQFALFEGSVVRDDGTDTADRPDQGFRQNSARIGGTGMQVLLVLCAAVGLPDMERVLEPGQGIDHGRPEYQ